MKGLIHVFVLNWDMWCNRGVGIELKIQEEVNVSQLIWYSVNLLGVENCSDHALKTETWYLLGVLFKISDNACKFVTLGSPLWGMELGIIYLTIINKNK